MPESHAPRFVKWKLSDAYRQGYLTRLQCSWCNSIRIYRPADLIKVLGDRRGDRIVWGLRCEKCGRNDYLDAGFFYPSASELQGLTIRTLVEVKIIRRPVWRDEPAEGAPGVLTPKPIDSIGALIDEAYSLTAYCYNEKCKRHDVLDLDDLARRLGRGHSAMHDHLTPKLKCAKCGGKNIGLRIAPPTGAPGRPHMTKKEP